MLPTNEALTPVARKDIVSAWCLRHTACHVCHAGISLQAASEAACLFTRSLEKFSSNTCVFFQFVLRHTIRRLVQRHESLRLHESFFLARLFISSCDAAQRLFTYSLMPRHCQSYGFQMVRWTSSGSLTGTEITRFAIHQMTALRLSNDDPRTPRPCCVRLGGPAVE
jgi:hypothetical protein